MNTSRKLLTEKRLGALTIKLLVLILTLAVLVTACGNQPGAGSAPADAPTLPPPAVVILTPTVAPTQAPAPTAAVTPGFITGRVHLAAPPTPAMVVYAFDPTTGQWAFTKTQASEGEAAYTLTVPPGSYQVFAAAEDWSAVGVGYWLGSDAWTLAAVPVAAGQTVSDIIVLPPSQSECGSMLGFPASPDGRFAATAGPTQECRDTVAKAALPTTTAAQAPVLPRVVPAEFNLFLQTLTDTDVPLVLPPSFPVEAGQPAIYPAVITSDTGEYELSLDYGPNCHGAGACHYGSLSGKKVSGSEPVGTRNNPFDAQQAQKVALAQGLQGYLIPFTCGASCGDTQVYWIVNGYQYMLGLKGGAKANVINLANAAIENSGAATP